MDGVWPRGRYPHGAWLRRLRPAVIEIVESIDSLRDMLRRGREKDECLWFLVLTSGEEVHEKKRHRRQI